MRVQAQRIAARAFSTPSEAVRFMLAMQGQDLPGAKWSVGLRVEGAKERDIDTAFNDGTLVRSWPMRGTLHITLAEDLPWMLALMAPRIVTSTATRRAQLALDEKTLERAREIAIAAFEKERAISREALLQTFTDRGIEVNSQRGYHILFHLALTGTLCLGPIAGKEQSFVRLDTWIPKPRQLMREAALEELALRYFTSHGPATMSDFIGWTKLTAKDAKLGVTLAGKQLIERSFEGVSHFMHAESEVPTAPAKSFALLPGFDEFVLGYKARDAVLDPMHFAKIVPGNNGMFMPTIVQDGRVIGTWKKTAKTRELMLEALPFEALSRTASRNFAQAGAGYGRFLGKEIRIASA